MKHIADTKNISIKINKTTSSVLFLGFAQKTLFINSVVGVFKVDKMVKIAPKNENQNDTLVSQFEMNPIILSRVKCNLSVSFDNLQCCLYIVLPLSVKFTQLFGECDDNSIVTTKIIFSIE